MKNELEIKILEEQSLKEKADNKLNNLEQEEIEIMKRIRTTTQVHKASNIRFIKNDNKKFLLKRMLLLIFKIKWLKILKKLPLII